MSKAHNWNMLLKEKVCCGCEEETDKSIRAPELQIPINHWYVTLASHLQSKKPQKAGCLLLSDSLLDQ